jgi:RNA polymerase sigma-70 factor (ECF subfamily)
MSSDSTRWTVIQRAAQGRPEDRAEFARRYTPIIRAYLGSRWRGTPLYHELDDALQQTFVQCFKEGGALGRVDPSRDTGFRAYLYGVVRNVALKMERDRARSKEQQASSGLDLQAFAAKDDSLAEVFDRAWASALLREASEVQLAQAREGGEAALRRHELLQLRFGEGLPIREIAARWNEAPEKVHRAYARARKEYRGALEEVVRARHGGGTASVERELERLRQYFG